MVDSRLNRLFEVEEPKLVWVTDITYITTQEVFVYLAVVIDLLSRMVVGWSLHQRQATDVALQAQLMAILRRKPKQKILSISPLSDAMLACRSMNQGLEFTSFDWAAFLRQHNLEHSMSRRGNCHSMYHLLRCS